MRSLGPSVSRLHRPQTGAARNSSGFGNKEIEVKENGIPNYNRRRCDDGPLRCDRRWMFGTARVVISRRQRLRSAPRQIIIRRYLRAKFGRRLAENAFEHPVELRQRLKTDIVSDFTDATIRIQELCAGILQSHASDVGGEFYPRRFPKDFAEMENARTRRRRYRA